MQTHNPFIDFAEKVIARYNGFCCSFDPADMLYLEEGLGTEQTKEPPSQNIVTNLYTIQNIKEENYLFKQNLTFLTQILEKRVYRNLYPSVEKQIEKVVREELPQTEEKTVQEFTLQLLRLVERGSIEQFELVKEKITSKEQEVLFRKIENIWNTSIYGKKVQQTQIVKNETVHPTVQTEIGKIEKKEAFLERTMEILRQQEQSYAEEKAQSIGNLGITYQMFDMQHQSINLNYLTEKHSADATYGDETRNRQAMESGTDNIARTELTLVKESQQSQELIYAKEQTQLQEQIPVKEFQQSQELIYAKEQTQLQEQIPVKEFQQSQELIYAKEQTQSQEQISVKEFQQSQELIYAKEQTQSQEQISVKKPLQSQELKLTKESLQSQELIRTKESLQSQELIRTKESLQSQELIRTKESLQSKELIHTKELLQSQELIHTNAPIQPQGHVHRKDAQQSMELIYADESPQTTEAILHGKPAESEVSKKPEVSQQPEVFKQPGESKQNSETIQLKEIIQENKVVQLPYQREAVRSDGVSQEEKAGTSTYAKEIIFNKEYLEKLQARELLQWEQVEQQMISPIPLTYREEGLTEREAFQFPYGNLDTDAQSLTEARAERVKHPTEQSEHGTRQAEQTKFQRIQVEQQAEQTKFQKIQVEQQAEQSVKQFETLWRSSVLREIAPRISLVREWKLREQILSVPRIRQQVSMLVKDRKELIYQDGIPLEYPGEAENGLQQEIIRVLRGGAEEAPQPPKVSLLVGINAGNVERKIASRVNIMEPAKILYRAEEENSPEREERTNQLEQQVKEVVRSIRTVEEKTIINRQEIIEQQKNIVREVLRDNPAIWTEGQGADEFRREVQHSMERQMEQNVDQMVNRIYRRLESKLKTERGRRGLI